jgi:hypothetical protein
MYGKTSFYDLYPVLGNCTKEETNSRDINTKHNEKKIKKMRG